MTQTDPSAWGPNLYAHLERHWTANDTNASAWSRDRPGINPATISRWQGGSIPSLEVVQRVADALDVTMLDLLIVAGIIDPTEVGRTPETTEMLVAGATDLEPWQRDGLLGLLRAMREAVQPPRRGRRK